MNDDQFTRLFKYMQREFGAVRAELEAFRAETGHRFDHVYVVLDTILKRQENYEQERLATYRQLDRHEGWIKQLASKSKLVPEP